MMKKIKNIIKENSPYIILFLVMLSIHLFFNFNTGDDLWFKKIDINNLNNYITERYNDWSSRIIIEIFLISLLKLPTIVWMFINSLMLVIIAFSINHIFQIKKTIYKFLTIFLILLYPLSNMSEVGWYATSLNYLWPLALGLFALLPIKNACISKKEKWYMYPLYIISLLYACNQEQMCAIIFCFYLIFTIYLYKNKKLTKFNLFQLFIAILSLIFIITCPGNSERKIIETATWYPEFTSFNILQKLYLGINSTMIFITIRTNIPFLLLSILLPVLSFASNKKNIIIKIITCIPIFTILILNIFSNFISSVFPYFKIILEKLALFINSNQPLNIGISGLLFLGLCLLVMSSVIITLFYSLKQKERYFISLIMCAGFASRIIMGFSPTIYASGIRTFIFLDFSAIIVSIYILLYLREKIDKKLNVILNIIVILLAVWQISNLIFM